MSHGEGDRVCLLDAWEGSGQQETPREPISELWRITSAVQLGFLYCYVPSPLTPSPHKTLFRHDGLVSAFTERNSEKGPIPGAEWDSRKQKQLKSRSRDHRRASSSSQTLMSDRDVTQPWKQHHGAWINSVGVPEMLVTRKLVEGLGFLRPSGQELRRHSCCIIKKCGFIVSFKTGEGWKFGLCNVWNGGLVTVVVSCSLCCQRDGKELTCGLKNREWALMERNILLSFCQIRDTM